jgi:hypothetical protein
MRAWEEILTPDDRFEISHLASLSDLNAKCATVLTLAEATDYVAEVAPAR